MYKLIDGKRLAHEMRAGIKESVENIKRRAAKISVLPWFLWEKTPPRRYMCATR